MKLRNKILSVVGVVGASVGCLLLLNNKTNVSASAVSNFNGNVYLYSTLASTSNYYYLSNDTSSSETHTGAVYSKDLVINSNNESVFSYTTGIVDNFYNCDYWATGISSDLKTEYADETGYLPCNYTYSSTFSSPYIELNSISSTDKTVAGESYYTAYDRSNTALPVGEVKCKYVVQDTGFYRCNFDMTLYSDSNYTMSSQKDFVYCRIGTYYTNSDNSVSYSGVYGKIKNSSRNNSNYNTSSYLYIYGTKGTTIEYDFYFRASKTNDITNASININCNYYNTMDGYETDLKNYESLSKYKGMYISVVDNVATLQDEVKTKDSEIKELKEKLGTYSGSPFESMIISSQVSSSDTMNILSYNDLLNNKYTDIYIDNGKLYIKKSSVDMIYQFSGLNVPISSITIKSVNDTGSSYIEYNLKDKEIISTSNLSADSLQSLTAYSNVSFINLYINSDMSADSEIIISLDSDNYYYTKGYNDGLTSGDSYQNGYSKGYENGKIDGINSGSTDTTISKVATLFDTILSYPASFIATCFNFELFGINISSVIFFIITLSVVGGIIAFIIGKRK